MVQRFLAFIVVAAMAVFPCNVSLHAEEADADAAVEAVADVAKPEVVAEEATKAAAPTAETVKEAVPTAEAVKVQPVVEHSPYHKVLLYIPNRIVDLSDVFSIKLGVGPRSSIKLVGTSFMQLGFEFGPQYFLDKGFDRQYGGGYWNGWNAGAACLYAEEDLQEDTFGTVKKYYLLGRHTMIPYPEEPLYKERKIDYWAFGVHAGVLTNVDLDIHPINLANFFTNIFLYRINQHNDF